MNVLKIIVFTFVSYQLLWGAMYIGSVWQSQTYPQLVKVTFEGNRQEKGYMSHAWNGDFLLTTEKEEIRFDHFNVIESQVPIANARPTSKWRMYIPEAVAISIIACMFFLFWMVKRNG